MEQIEYQKNLEKKLINQYGNVLSGEILSNLMGFPSVAAFRQGIKRGVIDIPIISFKNRRGKFALANDVAEWLTRARYRALEKSKMN